MLNNYFPTISDDDEEEQQCHTSGLGEYCCMLIVHMPIQHLYMYPGLDGYY